MTRTLSSADAHEGEIVRLEVVAEVWVENSVVILPGTTASAIAARADSKKTTGVPRQLALNIDSLNR